MVIMFKANEIYKNNLVGLLNSQYKTLDGKVRPHYKSDGKPAHTQYITDVTDVYDISKGEFPISTYRTIPWKSAIGELLWIYQLQSNDIHTLEKEFNIKWWEPWDIGDGTIGQRYGAIIKRYDLINKTINELKNNKYSRRIIMNMWQLEDFSETPGLNPCVYSTTWNVRGKYLDVFVLQRSSDYIVSEGFNRIQYCALLMMIAQCVGLKPGKMTYHVNNMHIYDRHIPIAEDILNNRPPDKQPKLILGASCTDFNKFTPDDFRLEDFESTGKNYKFDIAI